MRGGLEAIQFKMIYHDGKSKVKNKMKLIMSAKPLVIANSHANGQTRRLFQSQGWLPDLECRNRIFWFWVKKCEMTKN